MYDLIGDIHGHADELVRLLEKLGYARSRGAGSTGAYRHPERQVIFLGDFIDRGPRIREVLEIVRAMVDEGAAQAVMGNHEWNAVAFHTETPGSPGEFLRPHSRRNLEQHQPTIDQLTPGELDSYLAWFRTLPLWLELDGVRAVHACWDERAMAEIAAAVAKHGGVTPELQQTACRAGQPLFDPVETVLKGKEAALPDGVRFADKDGHLRSRTRVRWYLPPDGHTYRTYALTDSIDCDRELASEVVDDAAPYSQDAKPVFVGHYWLSARQPEILAHNVACLDYSVAKGGFLCAYRWNGERALSNENFVRAD